MFRRRERAQEERRRRQAVAARTVALLRRYQRPYDAFRAYVLEELTTYAGQRDQLVRGMRCRTEERTYWAVWALGARVSAQYFLLNYFLADFSCVGLHRGGSPPVVFGRPPRVAGGLGFRLRDIPSCMQGLGGDAVGAWRYESRSDLDRAGFGKYRYASVLEPS